MGYFASGKSCIEEFVFNENVGSKLDRLKKNKIGEFLQMNI